MCTKNRLYNVLFCFGAIFLSSTYLQGQVFVNAAASGLNDGSSWDNAYTSLREALLLTSSGEIWVAQGTYTPTNCTRCETSDREIAFNIAPNVQLYGGFAGNEDDKSQRDLLNNLTILSGDIGTINDSLDNSFRVLTAINSTINTILDGFVIQGANANGSFGFSLGGGIFLDANTMGTADMKIRNCTFRKNYAGGGGAIAIDGVLGGTSQVEILNCTFEGNTAALDVVNAGAAILISGNGGAKVDASIRNSTFHNNQSGNDGGAIALTLSGGGSILKAQIDSCTFSNNQAIDRGGAIWYRMSNNGLSQVKVSNCQFQNNRSGGQGGAVYARSSFSSIAQDSLINCYFKENQADGSSTVNDGEGGAVFLRGTQEGERMHWIINCIFDQNFAEDKAGALGATSNVFDGGICQTHIINSTFFGNSTNGQGGAIHALGSEGVNQMDVFNSILWQNSASNLGNDIANDTARIVLANTNVSDGINPSFIDSVANLSSDPQFLNPFNGDFGLIACSPMINIGDANLLPLDLGDFDNDGNTAESFPLDYLQAARIFDTFIDLGAIEWQGDPSPLNIEATLTPISCGDQCDGAIDLSISGGIPGYSFSWSTGDTTNTVSNLCTGTYYVTVSDAAGCEQIDSFSIAPNLPFSLTVSEDTTVCSGSPVDLSVTVSGGQGNIQINWSNGIMNDTSQTVIPTESESIIVSVSDEGGCSISDTINITVLSAENFEIDGDTLLCPNDNLFLDAGRFDQFLWSTGDTSRSISVESPGIYSVTVTSAGACQASDSINIRLQDLPEPEIIGPSTICPGVENILTTSTAYSSYSWSNGSTSDQISVTQAGVYQVTVSDEIGCQGQAGILITTQDPPNANIFGITQICPDSSSILVVGAFDSYLWSTGDTTQRIEVSAGGNYSVTVTDPNGCPASDTISVEELSAPSPQIIGPTTVCLGADIELSADQEYSRYQWSNGAESASIAINMPGTYTLTVTDASGCPSVTSILVEEQDQLRPIITGDTIICEGSSQDLSVGSFDSYLWSNGDTSQQISIVEAGIYTVEVSNASGCSGRDTINITSSPEIEPQIIGSSSICTGSSTTLSLSEMYNSYRWSTGDTSSSIDITQAGDYSVTVSNGATCQASTSFNVIETDQLEVSVGGSLNLCQGDSLDLDPGIFDSYSWSTGDTTRVLRIYGQGSYTVQVSNADGCSGEGTIEINEIPLPDISFSGDTEICPMGTGSIAVNDVFESYQWSTGDNSASITVNTPGLYQVTVSSESDCSRIGSINIRNQDLVSAVTQEDFNTCIPDTDISASLPPGTFGVWNTIGNINVLDPDQAQTEVIGLEAGMNFLVWSLSTDECPDYSQDTLQILLPVAPIAMDDQINIQKGESRNIELNVVDNDDVSQTTEWEISILNGPEFGTLNVLENGVLSYSVNGFDFGETNASYEICSAVCIDLCTRADININAELDEDAVETPNGITPNGDGQNETFVFQQLENRPLGTYPDNRLLVFNRWGDIVFEQRDYDNSWNGVNQGGDNLPPGTYYYILYLDIENKLIIKGDITIIR